MINNIVDEVNNYVKTKKLIEGIVTNNYAPKDSDDINIFFRLKRKNNEAN